MPLKKTSYIYQWLIHLVIVGYLSACAPDSIKSSMHVADRLKQQGRLFSHQLINANSSLHYMASCDIRPLMGKELKCEQHPEVQRVMVFIHGTPGDWSAFSPQLADKQWGNDTLLIAVDRPGWGQSALESERIEPSLVQQARDIAPLLHQLKGQFAEAKVYLVGHSLGATLAPLIAIELPELVDGVIAIAGDLSAEVFSLRWYNHIANLPVIRALIPRDMCFANEEVLALKNNLEQMEVNWHKLFSPMLVLQGGDDELVDPRNAELVKHSQPPGGLAVNVYPGLGHLMHLEETETINSAIVKWIQTQEGLVLSNK